MIRFLSLLIRNQKKKKSHRKKFFLANSFKRKIVCATLCFPDFFKVYLLLFVPLLMVWYIECTRHPLLSIALTSSFLLQKLRKIYGLILKKSNNFFVVPLKLMHLDHFHVMISSTYKVPDQFVIRNTIAIAIT